MSKRGNQPEEKDDLEVALLRIVSLEEIITEKNKIFEELMSKHSEIKNRNESLQERVNEGNIKAMTLRESLVYLKQAHGDELREKSLYEVIGHMMQRVK